MLLIIRDWDFLADRIYSDDLTVQVIFFGQSEKTGEVTINLDASAEGQAPKPKL